MFAACALAATTIVSAPAHAAGQRIDLRVLVVSDGQTQTTAIAAQLTSEGVPVTTVDLNNPGRPVISTAFLQDTVAGSARAKFQAVVLPNENPAGLSAPEMSALVALQTQFGTRQIDAYIYPTPTVGLNYPSWSGRLDGIVATASASARAGAFRYLKGPVAFEDNSPTVDESYGGVTTPLADDPTHGAHFETYLTGSAGGASGTLAGVYTHDGRSELALTFAYNSAQAQFRLLAHGLVTWLTKGVHLGYDRNYFAVHIDDVFLPDARWSTTANCTPGDCVDRTVTTPDIRMLPADVSEAVKWQQQRGFAFDMLFNGAGSDEAVAKDGSDELTDWFLANKAKFRWMNHTYDHEFLGCIQDVTVTPWRCQTDPTTGAIQYLSKADIEAQINLNLAWGASKGLPLDPREIVTGEHSGFFVLPQQPVDNPSLAAAFTQSNNGAGILWAGSDNSRDPVQRKVGSALTVPRYPMNIFYNVATVQEEVDEYNWVYTSRANGGSGICEDNPATTTCITPLNPATAFQSYLVPLEAHIAFTHIINNDPRPHYVHQSNISEGRILYPVLNRILDTYNATFATTAPLVNQRMSAIGLQMSRDNAWKTAVAAGRVTAYLQDGKVTVTVTGTPSPDVPLTLPEGTKNGTALWGTKYAGERSAYESGTTITLTLPTAASTV